jgi:hypothetical protein
MKDINGWVLETYVVLACRMPVTTRTPTIFLKAKYMVYRQCYQDLYNLKVSMKIYGLLEGRESDDNFYH